MFKELYQPLGLLFIAPKRPLGRNFIATLIIIPFEFTMLTIEAHLLRLLYRGLDTYIAGETCASALFKIFISEDLESVD